MSRELQENDMDSPESVWAAIRWGGAKKAAFNGKRGQAFLKELEAALIALPSKRLIDRDWAAKGDVCTLGALDIHRMSERTGMNWDAARLVVQGQGVPADELELYWDDQDDPAEFAQTRLGMTYTLAWEIIWENDQTYVPGSYVRGEPFPVLTPEQRYARMLKWVHRKIDKAEGRE